MVGDRLHASGRLLGMVMPTGSPTLGTIGSVGVVPEQRGQGYGAELLARGTVTLRRARYQRLVCDTDTSNVPMRNAFLRANWTQFATRREYTLPRHYEHVGCRRQRVLPLPYAITTVQPAGI